MDWSSEDNFKVSIIPDGAYIDDWSTFRIPTENMRIAWQKHSYWRSIYDWVAQLSPDEFPDPDYFRQYQDDAYYMMRRWEDRSHRYLAQNGGIMSMASGVPRNLVDFVA